MKKFLITLLVFSFVLLPLTAQSKAGKRGSDSGGGGVEIVDARSEVIGQFKEAHALIIGESDYINTKFWRRLPGVKEDAVAIKKLFEEQGFNVETINNANSLNLRNGIINFLDKYGYKEDARLVLYYAGHGETLDLDGRRMGYIVPVDAPSSLNDRNQINNDFLQKAVPMTQFEAWAVQYRSRHILFVFDSCFAGSVFRSQGAEPPAINRLINYPVRQFITSGDANEQVPDVSIFRKEFEHAIRNGAADLNNDNYISGTELGLYLYDKVSNYMNGKQNPRVGKLNNTNLDKGDFIFFTGKPSDRTPPLPSNGSVITEEYIRKVGSSATLTFSGEIPEAREKQTISSGLRTAMQNLKINLEFTENSNEASAYNFTVIIYKTHLPSGLLQAEVTITFSGNGRVLWQTNPYYITETDDTWIARRISERLRADQEFFNKINEIVR
jgi:hypothetical protein